MNDLLIEGSLAPSIALRIVETNVSSCTSITLSNNVDRGMTASQAPDTVLDA